MQENRSFDSYFGTFLGADGIPGITGNPGAVPCVPNPHRDDCDRPYHEASDRNFGGPHGHDDATADINGGRMDGFVGRAESGGASPELGGARRNRGCPGPKTRGGKGGVGGGRRAGGRPGPEGPSRPPRAARPPRPAGTEGPPPPRASPQIPGTPPATSSCRTT